MSHFLLGLAVPSGTPGMDCFRLACSVSQSSLVSGENPKKFISVARVGSGYTMKELWDLNKHLSNSQLRRNIPDWCEIGTEKPDVYIDPQYSKILQVSLCFEGLTAG